MTLTADLALTCHPRRNRAAPGYGPQAAAGSRARPTRSAHAGPHLTRSRAAPPTQCRTRLGAAARNATRGPRPWVAAPCAPFCSLGSRLVSAAPPLVLTNASKETSRRLEFPRRRNERLSGDTLGNVLEPTQRLGQPRLPPKPRPAAPRRLRCVTQWPRLRRAPWASGSLPFRPRLPGPGCLDGSHRARPERPEARLPAPVRCRGAEG